MERETATFVTLYVLYAYLVNRYEGQWWEWAQTRKPIDVWTFKHAMWGGLAGLMGVTRPTLVGLVVANEAAEYWVRRSRPSLLHGSESLVNVLLDAGAVLAGYELAKGAGGRK